MQVLRPHVFFNLRRAQGLLSLAEKYEPELIDEAAQLAISYGGSMTPKHFQKIIERLWEHHREHAHQLPLPHETRSFVRSVILLPIEMRQSVC
jgi:hypothetical protein